MTELIRASRKLTEILKPLKFSKPSHVYLPTDYARVPHELYLRRFGKGRKRVLFLGMNPGPWGMVQTGVPFGEVSMVRDWMGIEGKVGKPEPEHPKRPVSGFDCHRSEVSGLRLWKFFASLYPHAEEFFQHNFVINYCPLVWMSKSGANITPDKLAKMEIEPVDAACMAYLERVIDLMQPECMVGIGVYAEKKLHELARLTGSEARIGRVLHPSPASPVANRGWAEAAARQLDELGVEL